jgi:hypothetical protein
VAPAGQVAVLQVAPAGRVEVLEVAPAERVAVRGRAAALAADQVPVVRQAVVRQAPQAGRVRPGTEDLPDSPGLRRLVPADGRVAEATAPGPLDGPAGPGIPPARAGGPAGRAVPPERDGPAGLRMRLARLDSPAGQPIAPERDDPGAQLTRVGGRPGAVQRAAAALAA